MSKDYWVRWLKAAAVRAVKTFAQTAAALLGAGAVNVISVDWASIAGISATAAVVSLLTSLAGLPEVGEEAPVLLEASEVMEDDSQGDDADVDGDRGR